MEIQVLGGCSGPAGKSSIGANSTFIKAGELNILVDFGASYERVHRNEQRVHPPLPPPVSYGEIDFILLTHIHADHGGMVPWLMSRNENVRLVTTRPTFLLAASVWNDAHNIASFFKHPGLAPFSQKLYANIANRTTFIDSPGWIDLGKGVRACFGSNGHIRGSAFVVIEHEGKRVAFSGDVGTSDTPTLKGMTSANVPEDVRGVDLLFLESTHGGRVLPPREEEIAKMNEHIRATIGRGGRVLTAALSVDRSANISLDQVRGGVAPVFLDGKLTAEAWDVYQWPENRWCENDIPILNGESRKVTALFEMDGLKQNLLDSNTPASIVSSAGSLQGGEVVRWANLILPDPKSLLVQCSHQFDGTPGVAIESGARTVTLRGRSVPVLCETLRVQASTHASAEKLVEVASWFTPKRIALNHGAHESRKALASLLFESTGTWAELPLDGDSLSL